MSKRKKPRPVAEFVLTMAAETKCQTCRRPELAKAVREFAKYRVGNQHASWAQFHAQYVRGELGVKDVAYDAMMKHVRRCLDGGAS